jgi:hypothetical protein
MSQSSLAETADSDTLSDAALLERREASGCGGVHVVDLSVDDDFGESYEVSAASSVWRTAETVVMQMWSVWKGRRRMSTSVALLRQIHCIVDVKSDHNTMRVQWLKEAQQSQWP